MIQNFRTYNLAVAFYRDCQTLKLPYHLKDQLLRASSSIALNLAEGCEKKSTADRLRFYSMAFCSLRECQSILDLAFNNQDSNLSKAADKLGAHLYRLNHPKPG